MATLNYKGESLPARIHRGEFTPGKLATIETRSHGSFDMTVMSCDGAIIIGSLASDLRQMRIGQPVTISISQRVITIE